MGNQIFSPIQLQRTQVKVKIIQHDFCSSIISSVSSLTQHNQDDYQSFHCLPRFLILLSLPCCKTQQPMLQQVSQLLWPYANPETSADSPRCSQGGFTSRQIGSLQALTAIAAATVAAATAWWAAHGLLPLCPPLHAAFACPPASVTAVPSMNPPVQDQKHPEYSEAPQAQHSDSKSLAVISSDSETGNAKLNTSPKATDHVTNETISEHLDSDKTKGRNRLTVPRVVPTQPQAAMWKLMH